MASEPGDILSFQNQRRSDNYSGFARFTRSGSDQNPDIVTWRSDTSGISDHLKIGIISDDFEPERYVRLVTNGHRYAAIPWFKLKKTPLALIVGVTVAGVVVLGVGLGVAIFFIRRKREEDLVNKGRDDVFEEAAPAA
jgi:hypothetical protein